MIRGLVLERVPGDQNEDGDVLRTTTSGFWTVKESEGVKEEQNFRGGGSLSESE